LPFTLLIAVEPAAGAVSLALIGALAIAAVADAIGARTRLAGISLALPEIARLSKDREAKLELRIRNERQNQHTLRVALGFPREIQSPQEDVQVALPRDTEWSRFSWICLPLKRGSYRIDTACLEARSPFGFWSVRKTVPVRSELRVYPNLFTERRNLAALFLHRGAFGLHAQRQLGKGREFEKLREYVPGDGYDEIHWKATARRGRPITKVFQIERTQEVYVVIDASRLSARETVSGARYQVSGGNSTMAEPDTSHLTPGTSTLERFVTAALVLGLAAEQQGDLFGLLTFTDQVGKFVRARNGKAHYSACRDALYTLQPQIVSPDYDEVCTFIRLRLRRRALLVLLTSLDDSVVADSFLKNMDLIRRQHLVLVNMLQPPGVAEVFTNPNIAVMDDLYQHLGGHLLWHNLRELEKVLQRRGVHFSLLKNEKLSAELVSQYLGVKRRQLL
ncbi:MAG TPA: DUF58 domain-containing protein, partial [Verrucomicrobiae bacterium]|nr:DUF58 domain-containing protein [Verrucomicrobiae bacterium]